MAKLDVVAVQEELTELSTTDVVVHNASVALEVTGHLVVGVTKALGTGLWAGMVKGWNGGSAPKFKYFKDAQGNIVKVPV